MSTAQDKMAGYILDIASKESDLQKLAYGAKGLETLANTESIVGGTSSGYSWDSSANTIIAIGNSDSTIIQSKMKRCVLNGDGTVSRYLNSSNSNYCEDGSPLVLGVNENVMVEIPAFYSKRLVMGNITEESISLEPLNGFTLDPMFIKAGVEVSHRYIGAYEASESNGKLESKPEAYPRVSQTRAQFRAKALLAGNGNTGFHQWDANMLTGIQLLFMVEFAGNAHGFNSQLILGNGRTMFSSGSWAENSYWGKSGYSNKNGNQSGATNRASTVSISGVATDDDANYHDYMSYRGIENFFGNLWKFVDGIVVDANKVYLCDDYTQFADAHSASGYVDIGVTLVQGYPGNFANSDRGYFGDNTSGATGGLIGDHTWTNGSADRVLLFGALASDSVNAGCFAVTASNDSDLSAVNVASRLEF